MTEPLSRSRQPRFRRPWQLARPIALVAVLTVALSGVLALVHPAPAAAHIAGVAGSPTNARAEVTDVRPSVPGVTVGVGLGGQWVRLSNHSASEVVVLGYRGEPFLRLADGQVQVNELSSTAGQSGPAGNGSAGAGAPTTGAAPPAAGTPPKWVAQSTGSEATWADARVDVAPRSTGETVSWTLPLMVNGQRVAVYGDTELTPAPLVWPWVLVLALLAAPVAALGWRADWHRPLAAVVVAGTGAFVLHLLGTGLAPQKSGPLIGWIGVGAVAGFAALISTVTVVSLRRRRAMASDRVIMTGIMVLLLAFADITGLWNSQLPFAGPPVLDRALVVITYAAAIGLLVAGTRLNLVARRAEIAATEPGTTGT